MFSFFFVLSCAIINLPPPRSSSVFFACPEEKESSPFKPYLAACTGRPPNLKELADIAKAWVWTAFPSFGAPLPRDIPEE